MVLLYTPHSLEGFGFIKVSLSTWVLINGHKDIDFRRVYSPKFPRQLYGWRNTGWNDKIVALEKTTWFHFRLMKTGFLFFFVADHLLVGQLCTNPKSDRSLLSCLKVTQCSTSEIGDAPLCNQVKTTEPLPAPRVMKTKFLATVMVFGVVSREGHIMPHLRSRLESQHQSVPGCAEVCGDPLVLSGGWWQTLGVAAWLGAGPQVQRYPGLV